MNKKMICLAVCLMLPVSAFADIEPLVAGHNTCCAAAGAQQLTGSPDQEGERYTYHISDSVDVIFTDNGERSSFSCICMDEAGIGEFLAQCVTGFYNFGGLLAYSYCHDALLTDFLAARAGRNPDIDTSVSGLMFQVSKESFGYLFMLTKVN